MEKRGEASYKKEMNADYAIRAEPSRAERFPLSGTFFEATPTTNTHSQLFLTHYFSRDLSFLPSRFGTILSRCLLLIFSTNLPLKQLNSLYGKKGG